MSASHPGPACGRASPVNASYPKSASGDRPNLWPGEELPELREAFRALGGLMIRVGLLLAGHCDRYAAARAADLAKTQEPCIPIRGGSAAAPARCSAAPDGSLAAEQGVAGAERERGLGRRRGDGGGSAGERPRGAAAAGLGLQAVLARSPCPKGRLLHYYPLPGSPEAAERGDSTHHGPRVEAAAVAGSGCAGSGGGGGGERPADAQDTGTARTKQDGGGGQVGVGAEGSASTGAAGAAAEQGDWCGWHRDHGSLTGAAQNPKPCARAGQGALHIQSVQLSTCLGQGKVACLSQLAK